MVIQWVVGPTYAHSSFIHLTTENSKKPTPDTLAYGALSVLFYYMKFTLYKLLLLFVIVVIALIMYLTLLCYHFFFTAYNGETQVRQSFYPSASANELKVHGHQALFFPATKVRSCEAYRPAAKSYEIFMPQLKRRGTLVQEKQVNIKGLKLDR